ncbi:MAG: class I SAM-dependent methyltransferase [Candidatus Nitrospinota bacterium M3_3B_026]
MSKEILDKHYKDLADNYDDFLYYSPEFVRTLTGKMVEKLELEEDDLLVDLGCGTGMYTLDILKQVPLRRKVICVDPYPEMLEQIPEDSHTLRVEEDALGFSEKPGAYDKILMKEAVHHISDRARLFKNLHDRLNDGGVLLLVHVPPELDYPLFEKALARCREWHADPGELRELSAGAGFKVEHDVVSYKHSIPKDKYFKMVENRYMSALTSLGDDEIRRGLEEMERKFADVDVLEFYDNFDYIKLRAVKSS